MGSARRHAAQTARASRIKSFLRLPAVRALLIQLASFFLALPLHHFLSAHTEAQLAPAGFALMQGAIAAAISRWFGLAPWWLLIQSVFPIALVITLSLQLPPFIFLAAFIMLLGLYWSAFRTQVPFYPSGPATWSAVADMLPRDRPIRFVDIGSGLGGLVLRLAEQRPESTFIGVELAPLPWLASLLRGRIRRSAARFIRNDYERLDFASFDVVFAYLSPAAMPALWHKATTEMRAGSLLLSYEFAIPDADPDVVSTPADGGPALYGWYM